MRKMLVLLAAMFSGAAVAATGTVELHRDPNCGCCMAHAEYLRGHGFEVELVATDDIRSFKVEQGVPAQLAACHTALIDGYIVEGHVPVDSIERLLAERPNIAGISVPGMPLGSPGMDIERGLQQPLQVWTIPAEAGEAPVLHATYERIPR